MSNLHGLTQVEQALVDAIKTMIEAFSATNPTARAVFAESFLQQRDGNISKRQPKAAAVFEMLRAYCARDDSVERAIAQRLLAESPKGNA